MLVLNSEYTALRFSQGRDLERNAALMDPGNTVKKAMKQGPPQNDSESYRPCPGFRASLL